MRNFIAALTGLIAGCGVVMVLNGQPWFALLVLPSGLNFVWLVTDYRSRVSNAN